MRKNKTKFVILGLLSEGDLTGYEIKKIIDIRFSFFWNESYGQLYPELKNLEQDDLIHSIKILNPAEMLYVIRSQIKAELHWNYGWQNRHSTRR